MSNFKNQIDSDIKFYQQQYSHYPNIAKNEWAFNFWVLYNLFTEDESAIGDKIIDYHDMGIDCYEIYEDTNDVYLIQNKYYSDGNPISTEYVKNDFLIRGITALENGTYNHCPELQKYFTKHKASHDFRVYLQLYITNNDKNEEVDKAIKKWNVEHPKYQAQIFYLDDIKNKYFNEEIYKTKDWETKIVTINKGTILNINTSDYKLKNIIDARYVFTPVQSLYEMYRQAKIADYPIFEENIREYLGNKGVNKGIYETLLNPDERQNFFYYNNGITIICNAMDKIETKVVGPMMSASFNIKNPQIVNGCQTVNSIYQALDNVPDSERAKTFADTFVMVKILQVDKNDENQKDLYKNIVKYNNSQNNIDEKTFESNTTIFNRMQRAFMDKGFLIQIKQSDKNTFTEKYKKNSSDALKFLQLSNKLLDRFGINEKDKLKTVMIDLSKLLQVILAFTTGGQSAYNKKSNLLKYGTQEYKVVTEFIQNNTMDDILNLYLLFLRLEQTRNKSKDGRTPVVYYALDMFGKHVCNNRDGAMISEQLNNKTKINDFIKVISRTTKRYLKSKQEEDNEAGYNSLIKMPINYLLLDKYYNECYEEYQEEED